MKEQKIDVEMNVPYREIEALGRDRAIREILGKLRYTAQQRVEEAGGRLVPTTLPEIVVKRTSSILLGGDILLVASRWTATVPDAFDPSR